MEKAPREAGPAASAKDKPLTEPQKKRAPKLLEKATKEREASKTASDEWCGGDASVREFVPQKVGRLVWGRRGYAHEIAFSICVFIFFRLSTIPKRIPRS